MPTTTRKKADAPRAQAMVDAMLLETNPYRVLSISVLAKQDDIDLARKTMAMALHPDRNGGAKWAADAMAHVNAMHAMLSDKKRRKTYDTSNKVAERVCPKCDGTGSVKKTVGFKGKVVVRCPICLGTGSAT